MLELYGIRTKDRYFLGEITKDSWGGSSLKTLVFDGKDPRPTFDPMWVELDAKPSKIEKHVHNPAINHRFELKDPSMESPKFPAVLRREDVCALIDYRWEWTEPFEHLQSLYAYKEDAQPDSLAPVEYKIVSEVAFESFRDIGGFSYPVEPERGWGRDHRNEPITEKNVQNQLLDKILFPKIILSQMPCSLTSEQVYKIVRKHVKENINLKVARITSDYDFCFTVEKVIPLTKEEPYVVDENWNPFSRRKAKPKMVKRFRRDRAVKIFEMTNAKDKYKGYTAIPGITGNDADDLKEKIDSFLKGLMEDINEPVKECAHCEGTGISLKELEKNG